MSYADQSRRNSPVSIAAVVGVHLALGYALLSGLAYKVIKQVPIKTTITEVSTEPPPPPPHPVETQRSNQPVRTIVTPPLQHPDDIQLERPQIPLPPGGDIIGGFGSGGGTEQLPPPPPKPSQARDAVAAGDRLRWITTEDYPSAALRQGLQGVVVVSAMIGTDGRVRSCIVTQSSGSQLLDDTTCRLYTKRAHFTPARDADGNPTTAQRIDRFRWQIPNE